MLINAPVFSSFQFFYISKTGNLFEPLMFLLRFDQFGETSRLKQIKCPFLTTFLFLLFFLLLSRYV
jgi:hypothetical protein